MFTVTTVNLSADTTAADAAFGSCELGVLTTDEFAALLHRFRLLDSARNAAADPHLLVTAATGRFLLRTGRGKIFLYNARDTTEPYSELSPEEIVRHLDRLPAAPALPASAAPPRVAPRYGVAFAILVAGLALNGYTLYAVFYTESVNAAPAVVLLTDPAELAARGREALGRYATGGQPGDRVITVSPGGKIAFSELGGRDGLALGADTFRLGRRDGKFCFLTPESGVVDLVNPDTLVYYGDTYRRTR